MLGNERRIQIMFIKYGEYQHLLDLKDKGIIYFNPCKYFRDLEYEQQKKGIGDGQDGGIHSYYTKLTLKGSTGAEQELHGISMGCIMDPCLNTPIFCLRKSKNKFITKKYREILRDQFPNHSYALIIENEREFLENLRYHFKNRAFAHKIFYQDKWDYDFWRFLKYGSSDIRFYKPPAKKKYYADMKFIPDQGNAELLRIDDSNCYRSMYRKDMCFKDQEEYRVVLPYETQSKGKCFRIQPFSAQLFEIDELISNDS